MKKKNIWTSTSKNITLESSPGRDKAENHDDLQQQEFEILSRPPPIPPVKHRSCIMRMRRSKKRLFSLMQRSPINISLVCANSLWQNIWAVSQVNNIPKPGARLILALPWQHASAQSKFLYFSPRWPFFHGERSPKPHLTSWKSLDLHDFCASPMLDPVERELRVVSFPPKKLHCINVSK